MKIEGIFLGQIKVLEYNGRNVTTGIFKEAVEGPVKVTFLTIEGDKQADLRVHGGADKAVYAYPTEHYEYWKSARPDLSFGPGTFGENLAVSGMEESSVFIGDEYQIGKVTFKVTTPRMPCFKLGLKMGDPTFIKDFLKAHRTGFYFKVLQEGMVDIGDSIQKIGDDGYELSVKEVAKLYAEEKTNTALLQKAINSPSLPQDWKDHFQQTLKTLT
ncbi:MAG: MOSC domain-containing protein [Bacteroidota bacterium]